MVERAANKIALDECRVRLSSRKQHDNLQENNTTTREEGASVIIKTKENRSHNNGLNDESARD